MNQKNTIEYLAHLLYESKRKGKEKAIVFIGAGVSKSAGIPLAGEIAEDIKAIHGKNPIIRSLINKGKTDYYTLMGALTSDERRDLFHSYVTSDDVKLNLANVYLAQLLKEGYVDYVITVNFDDLIQKACAFFNFLPPVYDFSNIKTITTTDIRTGSVLYLHGQYFGQWLLNNKEELKKVENQVHALFNNIKTRRTWIVIGYSGNDGIFDKIKSLGSFSNELFWVKKELEGKEDKHVIDFLKTPNTNANSIEGYYADSFFIKLHAELTKLDENLENPEIFYKPFSFLRSVMQSVKDIKGDDELNKPVKLMIENCNDRIEKAIVAFENEDSVEKFKQEIIDAILESEFSDGKAGYLEKVIKDKKFEDADKELSLYYNAWGIIISRDAIQRKDEKLFQRSFEMFEKAIKLDPKEASAYNNYGSALSDLAKQTKDEELFHQSFKKYEKAIVLNLEGYEAYNNYGTALSDLAEQTKDEELFHQSFEQYEKAIELNPEDDSVYNNYGSSLLRLAKQTENEGLFHQSFKKYEKAIELNPKKDSAFNNYGSALSDLAKQTKDEKLYQRSFEQFEKAIVLNPEGYEAYNNYGTALSDLAEQTKDEELFHQSFEQFEKAIELMPEDDSAYNNYGTALSDLATQTKDEDLYKESLLILMKGVEKGGDPYNLACLYAIRGEKKEALNLLTKSLDNKSVVKQFVLDDEDWLDFLEDEDFLELVSNYE